MSKNNITEWLNSGAYKSSINEMRTILMRECNLSNSESSTASIFENELYFLIRQNTGIRLDFKKETVINGIHHTFGNLTKRSSGNGRLDAVVNNLVIEYKHYSKLNKESDKITAINQVKDYLFALKDKFGQEFIAILTDGIRICYFSFLDNEIKNTSLTLITENDIDTIIKAILANNTKRFVPENILKDFFVDCNSSSISKNIAKYFYNILNNNKTEKTTMLYEEWQNLMHLSVEDNGKSNDIEKRRLDLSRIFDDDINNTTKEYYSLYALQTTYAIIVKLIACKVIDKLEYSDHAKNYNDLLSATSDELQSFFEKLEDGYSYKNNNITNFLEGDFFSWYSDKNQWNFDLYKYILEIIKTIDEYSAFSLNVYYEPIDIFKDLYMSIIPKSIRHSMGEYFTPKWLADYVVEKSVKIVNNDTWKAIDPCCGSGIFIISLIKKIVANRNLNTLSHDEKIILRENILSRVYGIDINPLSVLSARVGYYLALRPLGDVHDIEIPVYLGDSAILAEKIVIDNIPCYKYSVSNIKEPFDVVLPERYVEQKQFGKIMSELQACVKTENSDILFSVLVNDFNKKERKSKALMSTIRQLSDTLVLLHKNQWDGIWIRIAMNFMLIARLKNFDIIIGNPPWVKWEHLPASYANKIKELCDIKHIFSGAGQFGGTQLNICALISNVTATNWLSKDGVLAFLMPDSIMSQNSYEGFRNFWIDYDNKTRLYLQEIDRWQAPLRPFRCDNKVISQDFNTYYYAYKYQDYFKGISVSNISRKPSINDDDLNKLPSYERAKNHLTFSKSSALQLSKNSTAFSYSSSKYDFSKIIGKTDYKYRTGVEFTPQELYMLTGKGNSATKNYYRFANKKFQLSKYIVDDMPKDGWDLPVEYIYPIITGPNIKEFRSNSNNEFCILPYDKNNTSEPISSSELIKTNKDLLIYLANHKELIDSQSNKSKLMHRGDEFYSLSKIGPYTFADNIVAVRDNSHFCSCVIEKQKTPWNEIKNTICVKHTIIISQDINNENISKDEAYYICGILNSEIVQNYMHSSFKSNGYSLNKSNIYLPKYDSKNNIHKQISEYAYLASTNLDINIPEIQKKIMNLYLDICKTKK